MIAIDSQNSNYFSLESKFVEQFLGLRGCCFVSSVVLLVTLDVLRFGLEEAIEIGTFVAVLVAVSQHFWTTVEILVAAIQVAAVGTEEFVAAAAVVAEAVAC